MADVDKKKEKQADDAGDQPKAEKKGMSPLMLIIIVAGGMLVLGIVAFILVFKILTAPPAEKAEEPKEVGKETYVGKLFSFEEPIIVNLAETKGQRYLKVSIQFEVNDEAVMEELKTRTPQMLDLMIGILSSKNIDDVSNTIGRNRLRREIIDKSNAELMTGKVINVYFTEFVIQ